MRASDGVGGVCAAMQGAVMCMAGAHAFMDGCVVVAAGVSCVLGLVQKRRFTGGGMAMLDQLQRGATAAAEESLRAACLAVCCAGQWHV